MYEQRSKSTDEKSRAVAHSIVQNKNHGEQRSVFMDNRPGTGAQRKLQHNHSKNIPSSDTPHIQMKKDAAIATLGDKVAGESTATKVIKDKGGNIGLYKYKYTGGNLIDQFDGKNIAKAETAKGTPYEKLPTPNIRVAVANHDLFSTNKKGRKLTPTEITNGGRPTHFLHADEEHEVSRTDNYTWHHKQDEGKMELIDMNVHGAMWHYGGIAHWKAGTHGAGGDDDPIKD